MNKYYLIGLAVASGLLLIILTIIIIKIVKRTKQPKKFKESWLEIQRLCASKKTWSLAVIKADKLLEKGLKLKKFKGKTMGERMVASQNQFTDNDSAWYAHNLAKKIVENKATVLRESQAKKAMVGVGKALRDLGLLNGK